MTDSPPQTWEDAVAWLARQPGQEALVRAAYFDLPVLEAAQRYHRSAEFAAIRSRLPKQPGRALDLGAGNGILSYALAADGWQVTAVEPYPSATVGAEAIRQLSKDGNVPIAVIEAFGEAIPLESANFDLVVARQVLHHAHDLKQFCFEMARLTRVGGQVITLRDHVISGPEQLQPFLDSHPLHHLYGGENAFTLEQYRTALEQAGLLVVEELRSFRSVVNYDPMSALDIRAAISDRLKGLAGPIGSIFSLALGFLPFTVIAKLAAFLDKRPGRLVSYIARKDAR